MSASFHDRFEWAIQRVGAPVCVGLDPEPSKLPDFLGSGPGAMRKFLTGIIEGTRHLVAAYKPNTAFFESYGWEGWQILEQLRDMVGPEVLLIADAKRADIGNTNEAYAHALFDRVQADAVTVHPYLGGQTLRPFCENPSRGMFVLCATSNPSASEVQELQVNGKPLYLEIAHQARHWSEHSNVGLVVGSTKPLALNEVLKVARDLPLLLPGGGAQGGDTLGSWNAVTQAGAKGLFTYSRSVLYASSGRDYADAARREVLRLHEQFNVRRTAE